VVSCLVQSSFIVANIKGLHTRPSTELVRCASSFKANISLTNRNLTVDAKSLLGVLILSAARGAKIRVEAEGIDAENAVEAILDLAKHQFYISY